MFKHFQLSCCTNTEKEPSNKENKGVVSVQPQSEDPGMSFNSEQAEVAANWEPAQEHKTIPFAKYDHQRRFHNIQGSPYVGPADVSEQERLVLQHKLLTFGFGCLFHLPIEEQLKTTTMKILDSGCGPGAWARQVAKTYPNAIVVGMDMSKTILNDADWKGVDNLSFVEGNLLERLPFEDNTFDAVYQRFLVSGIPKNKWVDVMKELKRITKPEGYIEIVEVNMNFSQLGPHHEKMLHRPLCNGLEARGIDLEAALNMKGYMEEVGIEVVKEAVHSAPIGWGGKFGELQEINFEFAMGALKPFLTKILSITDADYDDIVAKAKEECHTYETYSNNFAYVGKVTK